MTPEKHASLLAEWLEKPPGTPPPEGLEPEAIEAVYALRPDLAPAPKVSLDDILAGVSEGPFARTAELPISEAETDVVAEADEEVIAEADPETGRGQVLDLAAARRRRQKVWGGIGVVAAAALVLFTVFPTGDDFQDLAKEDLPVEAVAEAPEAPMEELAEAEPAPEVTMGEQPAAAVAEAREEPARSASRRSAEELGDTLERLDAGRYEVVDLDNRDEAAELKAVEGGASYGPAPEDDAGYALSAPNQAYDAADFEWTEEQAEEEAVQTSGSGGLFDRKRSTRGSTSSSAQSASIDEGSFADDVPAAAAEPIPSDLDGLRAAAAPGDYNPSWYLRSLDDEELDRFDGAIRTGDYAALIDDENALIGMDMAIRAAQAALSAGDAGTALSYARRGQGRSSANTAFRANLYYLEGLALERRGDTEGAKRAYTTAANLNRAR